MMKSSLNGLRILNTRPVAQAAHLTNMLHQMGAQSIELPMLSIEALTTPWSTQLPALSVIQHAIFTSANAVTHFFEQVTANTWPSSIHVIAIGTGTAKALKTHRILAHEIPAKADSEHLLALASLQDVHQQVILLVKGMNGLGLITKALTQRQAALTVLDVYQRTMPCIEPKKIEALWHQNGIDMIFISSQEAMNNLFTFFKDCAKAWLCDKPFLVISTRLAEAARAYGVKTILVSQYNMLLNTLEAYIHGQYTPYTH
jgi:uroporphyrinogen-III synthase